MKIVNIIGGLGNQMFQYAFLIALHESTMQDSYYDASLFKTYPLHNGFELNKCFNITLKQAEVTDIKRLSYYTTSYFWFRVLKRIHRRRTQLFEPAHSEYTPSLLASPEDKYYIGIWQDHRYFDAYKDLIKKEFSWKQILDDNNLHYYNIFRSQLTVSIHIRRGDYLNDWRYKDICELDYYQRSIEKVKSLFPGRDYSFAIFSNDIVWCRDNIVPLLGDHRFTIIDWNQGPRSSIDMQLMSACMVNIIANSSFSWWAAYLNIHDNAIIIAPQKWTNADVHFNRQLDSWILING